MTPKCYCIQNGRTFGILETISYVTPAAYTESWKSIQTQLTTTASCQNYCLILTRNNECSTSNKAYPYALNMEKDDVWSVIAMMDIGQHVTTISKKTMWEYTQKINTIYTVQSAKLTLSGYASSVWHEGGISAWQLQMVTDINSKYWTNLLAHVSMTSATDTTPALHVFVDKTVVLCDLFCHYTP